MKTQVGLKRFWKVVKTNRPDYCLLKQKTNQKRQETIANQIFTVQNEFPKEAEKNVEKIKLNIPQWISWKRFAGVIKLTTASETREIYNEIHR